MSMVDDGYFGGYFGGAVLADESCGAVSFSTSAGGVLSFKLDHDPEYTMSGLHEPCSSFEKW